MFGVFFFKSAKIKQARYTHTIYVYTASTHVTIYVYRVANFNHKEKSSAWRRSYAASNARNARR